MDYDIGEAFQKIEEEMIASMSRNLSRHLKKEEAEGINYSMWQAEQLAALNRYRKDNREKFGGYFSTINKQIEDVLKRANESGKMTQEAQILKAIQKGWRVARHGNGVQGAFFRINDRKLDALIRATTRDMAKAEHAMLRMTDDVYRKTIYNAGVFYNTGAGTLEQCVDMATRDFLSRGINCVEYANGARVGIETYARMALRTAQTRAYIQGESAKRDEWGVNTVIVNKRGAACPRCMQWLGRVFYDDVFGSIPVPDDKYPLLSTAIEGGLFHPNCKDSYTTFFPGINTEPKPPTKEQIEEANRVYTLEQRQNYNNRMIQKYKRLAVGSIDSENQAKYAEKVKEWEAIQRDFVHQNSDVLRMRRNNRYDVGENSQKTIAISEKGAIIGGGKDRSITEITDSAIDRVPFAKIEGYSDEQCLFIQKQHRELLRFSRDSNESKEVAFVFRKGMTDRKEFLGSDDRIEFGTFLTGVGNGATVLHNHPRNGSFSDVDIGLLISEDNVSTLTIVKNNGGLETLTKARDYNKEASINELKRAFKKYVKNGTDDEKDVAVSEFLKRNGGNLLWSTKK